MSNEEKHYCTVANIGKWYVYFFSYFDYQKAMESLVRADEISQETGQDAARISLNFGCMYQTLAEQSGASAQYAKALDFYRRAYDASIKVKDMHTAYMSLSNIITISYTINRMPQLKQLMASFSKANSDKQFPQAEYTQLLYKGLLAMSNKQYDAALQHFARQLAIVPDTLSQARFRAVALNNSARAYAAKHDYVQARQMVNQSLVIAQRYDMKDLKLEVYQLLSDYTHAMGDSATEEHWRMDYLALKDTLLNYQQLATVNEVRTLQDIRKIDERMQREHHQRQNTILVAAVLAVVAIIVGLFCLIIYRKNRELRRRNRHLYLNNVEMLRREEERKAAVEAPQNTTDDERYRNSNLDDEAKTQLLQEICRVMDTDEHIYDLDFSQNQLADIIGSKSKYVSQVINELCQCNFSTFVNEYRIKEACKRINDHATYGNMTIEAISLSVGFKSRSTFNAAFRKFTGLTPREYMRAAEEQE